MFPIGVDRLTVPFLVAFSILLELPHLIVWLDGSKLVKYSLLKEIWFVAPESRIYLSLIVDSIEVDRLISSSFSLDSLVLKSLLLGYFLKQLASRCPSFLQKVHFLGLLFKPFLVIRE